jgi:uncharacterized membrane protein
MPSIAAFHPQIVHFAVALLIVGILFRVLSFIGRPAFLSPAATTLILMGTLASALAVRSGLDAHGPVERVPGARAAVSEHEEWGIRARNIFFGVATLELIGVAFLSRPRTARGLTVASAVFGLVGAGALYQAAEHGGALVYSYAGGVGVRTGNPADVSNLLVAGLYHQANQDLKDGKGADGAALLDLAAQRNPQQLEVQLTAIEWTTDVRNDPARAIQRLDALTIPADNARLRVRAGLARASALKAQGNADAAKAVLQTLQAEFPSNPQIQRRLSELTGAVSPSTGPR